MGFTEIYGCNRAIFTSVQMPYALLGSIYTYGNIQPYIVSYIRERSHPSSLRYTQSTYLYSTQYAGYAVGLALGGLAEKMLGARMSVLVGGILASLGLFLSYLAIQHSFWIMFITYGLMYSIGVGVVYFVTIACATQWVRKRAGLAVGMVIGGVGLGGLVFGTIQTGFINQRDDFPDAAPYADNPDEKYFTQTGLIDRVPYIFLIKGLIFTLLTIASLPFIANPLPIETSSTNMDCQNMYNRAKKASWCTYLSKLIQKMMHLFLNANFWLQWMVTLQNILGFGVIASLYKTYGIEVLKSSDYFLTALGAVANGVFSIIGRLIFGILADKIGYKLAYAIQSGLMAIFLLTLYTTALGYPSMYFVWVCCMFLCYGGFCTLVAIAVLKGFGNKDFNFHYAMIVTTSQIFASFLYGIVSDFCVDYFDWSGTFLLIGCITIVQMILVLLFSEGEPKDKKYVRQIFDFIILNQSGI